MTEEATSVPMTLPLKAAVATYIVALNLTLIALLIRVWPVALTTADTSYWSPEGRFLITALVAGALGSYIHLATSFIDYAGARTLGQSWGWWYLLRPSIGAALALVVYFVLRAGLISGAGDSATANLNPYGVASLAALSGMFSKQATEKLRDTFEHICATKPEPEINKDSSARQLYE
jgi:hypothetical protein